tara:strand:+ start:273 stop:476 length:204 start_codon:yes stop_codon:yes gene_type:complete
MTPERAKQILAQSKYAELQMSPSEGDYINKIWREHPNGDMSIYTTLVMIAFGYDRALKEIQWQMEGE